MPPPDVPLLEFDICREALIEPSEHVLPIDAPEHCVPCFFQDVLDGLRDEGRLREIGAMGSEMGRHPLYEIDYEGRRLALFQPGLTAPFGAAMLEEVICMGCRKFVACGGAGVLIPDVHVGHVIVPSAAVRDEGTSYHYLPPSREVEPSPEALEAIEAVLEERDVDYLKGKTWTTDAIYRETRDKVQRRRDEGCLAVEMEAAAFFAVARFRGVPFGQILYGGDDVSGERWDNRDWQRKRPVREDLLWLAAEACLRL
ncbi:MAG: purine-nucleoside phosphorylase [Candidatus Eisenbacteria bacterium]|nr:purine-nucleoside phosphorylase [Candidatus Eisenbacteria bacterium]